MTTRKIRFGVSGGAQPTATAWREQAKKAEDLGFSCLLVGDHMGRNMAPLLALLSAADATTNLHVSTQVISNDFRNPVVLAKEIATLDFLTDGRFEPGIGTGWPAGSANGIADYAQTGLVMDPPGKRVSRLEEVLTMLREYLRATEPFDYEGEHYTFKNVVASPRRAEGGPPPIMVAGAGPRIVKIASRLADIINIAPRPPIKGQTPRGSIGFGLTMADEIGIIKAAAGDRYDDIELSVFANNPAQGNPSVTDDPEPWIEKLAAELGTTSDAIREMPATLIGPEGELIERIQRDRDLYDISYRIVPAFAMDAFAPIVAKLAGT